MPPGFSGGMHEQPSASGLTLPRNCVKWRYPILYREVGGAVLTPRRKEVYDALVSAWRTKRTLPTPAELAATFGVTYPTLQEHLRGLAAGGFIIFESRGRGRAPRMELVMERVGVPLLGEIAAGIPLGVYPEPEALLSLPGHSGRFALRIQGDSMADRIAHGDIVLLDQEVPSQPGLICAVRLEETETTLKYVDWRAGHGAPSTLTLRPHNPRYETLTVPANEVHIDGVFRGLLRGAAISDLIMPL